MDTKKLGTKYTCFKCSCKFYDLNRPQPICPKCGADQNEAPKKASPEPSRYPAAFGSRPRARRRPEEEFIEEPPLDTEEDEELPADLEDGLSILPVDEDEEPFEIEDDEE